MRPFGRPGGALRSCVAVVATLGWVLLSGCSSSPPSHEINLFAWSEYVPRAVIEAFTQATGIKVNYDTFASNEEMLAKIVSGAQRYDVIQPSDYTLEALVRARRLLPLDFTKIPNFRNIGAQYRNLPQDPEQKYSVPWMAGSVGIVVNAERIHEPVRGFADVFQEKYRGRIIVVDDPREMVMWALATLGKGPNDITPETLALAKPILERWLPLVKVFDSDSPKTALLNGDADVGIVWSGEAALLYRTNPKFQFALPVEGTHQFLDCLAIPADAPNPDGAHQFIDYVLRPEVSKLISTEFPYTNPNLAARQLLSPEELHNPASYPPGDPKLEGARDIGAVAVQVDKLITDLKAQL